MNVLCIEATADGLLDLAVRAQALGHSARYHLGCYDAVKCPVGKGLVEREHDWRRAMKWADLVVVGGNGKWIAELDKWRSAGVAIIGGCAPVAALELDRMLGMAAFKRKGIPLPPYRQCSTLREAIEYVTKEDRGFAVKVCGDVADKTTSIVGKDAKGTLWRLERWRKEGKSFPSGLMVQERIEGIEFAVGGWIGPNGFAEGWEENFEEKKLYTGGLGPNVGESGTVLRLVKKSKIADKVLKPFEEMLVNLGYVGNVDVNCIVDEDGTPWPLEWTCRLGWPAFNIECALHADPVEFLAGLAAGKPPKTRRLDEIAVGVVLTLPPYPYGHEKTEEVVNVPIWGVTPALAERLHFCNVMQNGEGLASAGSYVMVATGTGDSVQEARRRAYGAIKRVEMPASPFYRVDIGQRLRTGLDELQRHGFAEGMRFS